MKNFYDTKILVGPGAYLVPTRKIIPGRILYIQPGKWFFTPEQPLHPGLTQNFSVPFTQNALNTAAEPLRMKFSGEPDPYYSCKTFRFAQPGESNRISANLWISIDSHRQQTKFTAFQLALKPEIKYCALYPLWSSRTGNGLHSYLYTRHNKTRPSMFPESLVFFLSLFGWAEPICPTLTSIF